MNIKFAVGQCVEYVPVGTVGGRYIIVRPMPNEYNQSEPRYRIRGEEAGEERVVAESALSENVGSTADYVALEKARTAHFKKTDHKRKQEHATEAAV